MDPTREKVPDSLIITRCGPNKKCVQTEGSFRVEQDQWAGARLLLGSPFPSKSYLRVRSSMKAEPTRGVSIWDDMYLVTLNVNSVTKKSKSSPKNKEKLWILTF